VAITNINQGLLQSLQFPYPPLEEQDEIVDAADQMHRKIGLHKAKLAALSTLFRTLLHQLMTAEIRVRDLEPAAKEL